MALDVRAAVPARSGGIVTAQRWQPLIKRMSSRARKSVAQKPVDCAGDGGKPKGSARKLCAAADMTRQKNPAGTQVSAGKSFQRAGDRTRTGDVQLGKLAFYH